MASKKSKKKEKEEIKSDFITGEKVRDVVNYSLERYTNISNFISLAEYLRQQQEFGLVMEVCKKGQQKLEVIETDRVARSVREIKVAKIEKKLNEKKQKEALKGDLADPLKPGESNLWKWIQLEKSIVNLLPRESKLSQNANFDYQIKIAKIMLGSVLDACALKEATQKEAGEEVDDVSLDKMLEAVISTCTKYVINPNHLKDISVLLSSKEKYDLALDVCKQSQSRVQGMRKRLQQKLKLDTLRWQLQQEEERLKPIKKGLSKPQKELLEVQKDLKALPKRYSFDPEDMNKYDTMSLDLTQQMLKIALDNKSSLKHKAKLVKKTRHVYTKKERLAVEKGTADQIIKDVLKECMAAGNVEDPFHLHQIAQQLYAGEEWDLAYPVIAKARERIGALIEEFKQRSKDKERMRELQDKRADELKEWRNIKGEDKKVLDQLEFDNYVFENFESLYKKNSPNAMDDLHLKVMTLLIDNMMTHHKEKAVEYKAKANALLDSVEKPKFLYQIARHIEKKWKLAYDTVLAFGDKCQHITNHVEELRQSRQPLTAEADELRTKIEDLKTRNRDVRKDDTDRLAELEKLIAALPEWPEYGILNDPYQYDQLNLDVVRVMISAILNKKVGYEERIEKMRKEVNPSKIDEGKIEADRQKIQREVQDMVKTCLERFANPADLLKVCKDMKNRQEVDIVLQIAVKCLQRIVDIEDQRTLRSKVVERLEKAKEDKNKKAIAKHDKKLRSLPGWPHYAKLQDPRQYNGTKYEIVKVALDAVLDHQERVEANISHQYYLDKKGVDEKKIQEQRAAMQQNIDQIVALNNTHIKDANLLFAIARELSQKKQASILLMIAPAFYKHIRNLEAHRQTKDKRDNYFQVLQDEKRELQRLKKDLRPDLEEARADIEKELELEKKGKGKLYPDDMGVANTHAQYFEDFTDLLVRTSFATNEAIEKQIKEDTEKDVLTETRVSYLNGKIKEHIKITVQLIRDNVLNPLFIKNLAQRFLYKELYEESISLGLDSLDKKDTVATAQEKNTRNTERKEKLIKEREELDKRRKKLEDSKVNELRELELQLRIFMKQPSYVQTIKPQRVGMDISKDLIAMMVKAKTALAEASKVVDTCLHHMSDVDILMEFTEYLIEKTEYRHAIKAGVKCEDHINEFYADLEKREGIKKKIEELEEKRLRALASDETKKAEKLGKQLQRAKDDLEKLPELEHNKEQLDSWILKISGLVVDAAKILDDDEVLSAQTVMAFKIDTSIERWDQVRNMVSDEKWDIIKQELVVFVLKRDDNPVDKIELLMKDGLFEHCVNLFPPATGKDKELDLLVRLWKEVEENAPRMLERFIPIVCRYMKRYYQEHKYEIMDPLLDRVAHWYPSVVVDLYKQATDMVLLWILPSQYTRFCDALKRCKKRLVDDLKRKSDWEDLVRDFKRQHYGKRKLLQMLLSIVDDPDWDLDVVINVLKKKGI
eukprot:TRINITY_DN1167_c0_g2_i1.p1 TRINITY_DN1167_c0_g2~~TRINITY_DN1167_c0_g2_i1.p1  ORF type:complete len:1453 (-),score=417.61 TRINITY_DN1167_c0_g2_i1:71-4429(-)